MESYPAKFKSFQWKIVRMRALQELQNSLQTYIILWLVYPIHTNFLYLPPQGFGPEAQRPKSEEAP